MLYMYIYILLHDILKIPPRKFQAKSSPVKADGADGPFRFPAFLELGTTAWADGGLCAPLEPPGF